MDAVAPDQAAGGRFTCEDFVEDWTDMLRPAAVTAILVLTAGLCFGQEVDAKNAAPQTEELTRVGEFDVREIRYTGGEYQNERFRYLLLPPENVEAGKLYPLVFFLHGAGERGDDPRKLLPHLPTQMARPEWRKKYPGYFVAPQCRPGKQWVEYPWSDKESSPMHEQPSDQLSMAIAVLEKSLEELPVDRNRVYLTGLSMGGFGSWELAMRRPELFAAVAPVCGGGDESQAALLKQLPIWAAHGDADRVVWPVRSRTLVEAVMDSGGNIRYTEYAGVGHNSWTPFYSASRGVIPWMFRQVRSN